MKQHKYEQRCKDSPLISPEDRPINTSLSDYVDVAKNTRKYSVCSLTAAAACGKPRLTAVLKQRTEHSTFWLRQLQQLWRNLKAACNIPTSRQRGIWEMNDLENAKYSSLLRLRWITCFKVAMRLGASACVSWRSLCWKAMEMKPFKADQKSWAFVLSARTSSQLRVTARTQSASSLATSWNQKTDYCLNADSDTFSYCFLI